MHAMYECVLYVLFEPQNEKRNDTGRKRESKSEFHVKEWQLIAKVWLACLKDVNSDKKIETRTHKQVHLTFTYNKTCIVYSEYNAGWENDENNNVND